MLVKYKSNFYVTQTITNVIYANYKIKKLVGEIDLIVVFKKRQSIYFNIKHILAQQSNQINQILNLWSSNFKSRTVGKTIVDVSHIRNGFILKRSIINNYILLTKFSVFKI